MKTKRSTMMALAACLFWFVGHDALGFYNPSAGRWLSRDPIEEDGGENLFGMIRNDNVNIADYLGLGCWVDFVCKLRPGLPPRPSLGSLVRNCTFDCVESNRVWSNAGTVTCEQLPPAPLRISVDRTVFCEDCPKTTKTYRNFTDSDLRTDCSRKKCREGCDATFNPMIKFAKDKRAKAVAIALKAACYDLCNTICRDD